MATSEARDQKVTFTHEYNPSDDRYKLTAFDPLTGKLMLSISMPKSEAVGLVQGMVSTLLGEQ